MELVAVFVLGVGVVLGDRVITHHGVKVALGEVFKGEPHFVVGLHNHLDFGSGDGLNHGRRADLAADPLSGELFEILDFLAERQDHGLMQFIVGIGEQHGLLALVGDAHGRGDHVHLIRGQRREDAVPCDVLDLHVKAGFLAHGFDVVNGESYDFLVLIQHFVRRERGIGRHDKRLFGESDRGAQQQGQQGDSQSTEHVYPPKCYHYSPATPEYRRNGTVLYNG